MTPKEKAIELAESLHSINNSDGLMDNVELICKTVIDTLESVVGSQRYVRTQHENDTLDFWEKVAIEAKKLKF